MAQRATNGILNFIGLAIATKITVHSTYVTQSRSQRNNQKSKNIKKPLCKPRDTQSKRPKYTNGKNSTHSRAKQLIDQHCRTRTIWSIIEGSFIYYIYIIYRCLFINRCLNCSEFCQILDFPMFVSDYSIFLPKPQRPQPILLSRNFLWNPVSPHKLKFQRQELYVFLVCLQKPRSIKCKIWRNAVEASQTGSATDATVMRQELTKKGSFQEKFAEVCRKSVLKHSHRTLPCLTSTNI